MQLPPAVRSVQGPRRAGAQPRAPPPPAAVQTRPGKVRSRAGADEYRMPSRNLYSAPAAPSSPVDMNLLLSSPLVSHKAHGQVVGARHAGGAGAAPPVAGHPRHRHVRRSAEQHPLRVAEAPEQALGAAATGGRATLGEQLRVSVQADDGRPVLLPARQQWWQHVQFGTRFWGEIFAAAKTIISCQAERWRTSGSAGRRA